MTLIFAIAWWAFIAGSALSVAAAVGASVWLAVLDVGDRDGGGDLIQGWEAPPVPGSGSDQHHRSSL